MRSTGGMVPESAQGELKSTLREQDYFLSCQWHPQDDVIVSTAEESELFTPLTVLDKQAVSPNICRLLLNNPISENYRAGQFINLRRKDGLSRSYSLASLPGDDFLELHIKRMKNGAMSNWIYDELKPGDSIDIQGPYGECFYIQENTTQPLMLIGTGTGASPLWGIVRDALQAGHTGKVYFFHGARKVEGLYLDTELKTLSNDHENFTYVPCISGDDCPSGYHAGRSNTIALKKFSDLRGWRVYICGLANMVNNTKKQAYLSGAEMNQIYVDPFEMTELRSRPR
jgi:NAD(P)H-flavin reductase